MGNGKTATDIWLAFSPAAIIAVVIMVASMWEFQQVPQAVALHDKFLHGLMYTFLSAALMAGFVYIRQARVPYYILACAGATFYGAIMEFLQRYCTLSRSGEMADLFADFIGALIGVFLVWLYTRIAHVN